MLGETYQRFLAAQNGLPGSYEGRIGETSPGSPSEEGTSRRSTTGGGFAAIWNSLRRTSTSAANQTSSAQDRRPGGSVDV